MLVRSQLRYGKVRPSCWAAVTPRQVQSALAMNKDVPSGAQVMMQTFACVKTPLSREEQAMVLALTRTPHKVTWPDWWNPAPAAKD